MRIHAPTRFTAVLLAASLAFLVLSARLDAGVRIVPLSVAVPLSLLLLVQLIREVRRPPAAVADPSAGMKGPGPEADARADPRAAASAVRWILAFALLIGLAGLIAGPALFVALYLRRRSRETWLAASGGAAMTAILFWLVATRVIGAPAPMGLIGGWMLTVLTGR